MTKSVVLLFSVLFICSISACKKDAKLNIPAALLGEWHVRKYTITTTTNNITAPPYVYFSSDTATSVYYQFNGDGTGFDNDNDVDPAFISVPPTKFNYKVSGSSIIFSEVSATLESPTCSFQMPTSSTLVIRSTYSGKDSFGNTVSTLQELDLGK